VENCGEWRLGPHFLNLGSNGLELTAAVIGRLASAKTAAG
jgi:hypothetical protein